MTAFMIFFSGDRKYSDPFLALVTMIVWMLGELEYADILFPNDEVTRQKKIYMDEDGNEMNEETCDIEGNSCEKRYVGEIETVDDYLQFSGENNHLELECDFILKQLVFGTWIIIKYVCK